MSSLSKKLSNAFEAARNFIPSAKVYYLKIQAQENLAWAIKMKQLPSDPDAQDLVKTFLESSKKRLQDAGQDVESDIPYQKILGLKGGKAEFDALQPK